MLGSESSESDVSIPRETGAENPIALPTWGVARQEPGWRTGWFPETQQPESQENSGFKSPLSLSGRLGAAF
jgi:hypothetical protein